MNADENLDFIKVMCETGESGRYGHRPIADAVESFAQQVAQHARHQFNEGRALLLSIKRGLRTYGDRILKVQLNDLRGEEYIAEVKANYVGQWEWYVTLRSKDSTRIAGLVFGPTAATCNAMVEEPLPDPDYGKVFILGKKHRDAEIDFLVQSQVGLKDVLDGIDATDTRLRDDLLEILGDH